VAGSPPIDLSELSELADPVGLLFDLDGTLVDTVETRIAAWLRTFAEVGIPADRQQLARLIGADGKRLAREVAAVAGRELSSERAEAIDRRAGEIYGELNVNPRPLPGAQQLLAQLAGGRLRWAIATSSRAEQVAVSVEALGLAHRPLIVDGSSVEHAKPAPDLLLRGADRLAVPAGGCWCIGDSTWEIAAARAAGMIRVAVSTGAASPALLIEAGADTVTDLPAIEQDLRQRGLLG
jgi:HAD superfamily hydrolase (TIGR01509 family)